MTDVKLGVSAFKQPASLQFNRTQQSVHPTVGSLRVFGHFARLEVGSVKMAFSRLAHQPRLAGSSTGNASRWAGEGLANWKS
jgi:hypothetical protein